MLKKLLYAVVVACIATAAHASVTINANGVANLVLSSSGTDLANGDIVRIGYFNISSGTSILGSNSYATLNADFTPIGEGGPDGDTLTESGNATDTMDINSISGAGTFAGSFGNVAASFTISSTTVTAGTLLYIWVFNSSTPTAASQWTILGDSTVWQFPANNGALTMSLGSAGITDYRGTPSGSNYELAAIPLPEPTSLFAIGSLVVLGGAALRRRRS